MSFPYAIDLTTDWHCHLLPGLDDGPATLEESIELARSLASRGVRVVHCTPHCIKGSYEYTPHEVKEAVTNLQAELDRQQIQLELKPGMEYLLDEFFAAQLENPLPLGDSDLLLIESYPTLSLEHLKEHIFAIVRAGLRPLLAHPERNALLAPQKTVNKRWWSRLLGQPDIAPTPAIDELRAMGCLFQGNLGSLTGYYGKKVQLDAHHFLSHDLYDHFGSDAHALAHWHAIMTQPKVLNS